MLRLPNTDWLLEMVMRGLPSRGAHRQQPGLRRLLGLGGSITLATMLLVGGPLSLAVTAATTGPITLGAASGFLVLAGTGGIANTGKTIISGDIGADPNTTIAGITAADVGGTTHAGDDQASAARSAVTASYAEATGRASTGALPVAPNGTTLPAGVYAAPDAVNLTGTLTLDGANDPTALFILQVPAALTTAASSVVALVNGAQASHVFWQVNGAATLGANSTFAGTLMTAGAITAGASSRIAGRLLSTGTVTLASNTITFGTSAPPLLGIAGGGAAFTLARTAPISGSVSPVTSSVRVTLGGQTLTSPVDAQGGWSVTPTSLTNGRYVVRAVTADADGNLASAIQSLTIGNYTPAVALGKASSFLVLGGGGVGNTSITSVSANVGSGPNTAITGLSARYVGGTLHAGDAVAVQALQDLTTAYNDAAARTPTDEVFAGDLNGRTFTAGVHPSTTAIALTGVLTLDGQNDPNSVFIFQLGAALTAAANSTVNLINGAQASHVFWQIKGAATLGASAVFGGNILATGAISAGAAAILHGAALTPAVITLAGNTVTFNDAPPPKVTITGGAKAFTIAPRPTISGTLVAATQTVQVTVNGQSLLATADSSGLWTVQPAFLSNGRYDVVALVVDAAGNQGSAFQSLTIGNSTRPISLGTTATFSALSTSSVANTGASSFDKSVGTGPGGSTSGLPAGTSSGTASQTQTMTDLKAAYDDAAARVPTDSFAGDQNGQTFVAGVRSTDAAFGLTGILTLDGQGDPNSVFVIQVHAALTTAAASAIRLINGAQAGNVYWQVAGAATLGANSTFVGTLLTAGAITVGDGTQLIGRVLAQDAITLANNSVSVPDVVVIPDPVNTPDPTPTPSPSLKATASPSASPSATPTAAPGTLSITVATQPVTFGALSPGLFEGSVHASLGQIRVVDSRDHSASQQWTATVTISAFTNEAGAAMSAVNMAGYVVGSVVNGKGGKASYVMEDLADELDRTHGVIALTATNLSGTESVTWDPTISIFIPSTALAGHYTATITHSVY